MNLGILLPLGESLSGYAQHGQDVRFVKYYLQYYCQQFDKVFVFSYKNEKYPGLPRNCFLICPGKPLHRYLYGLFLPYIHRVVYKQCSVFRCFHPSAAMPAIIGKLFYGKKFIFNYNYDYLEWARVEGKGYLAPLLYLQQRLAFAFCDHVFVADEKTEQYAHRFVAPSKITLVRNAVDTNLFRPSVRKHKGKVILSVGRLEPQKNYEQLLEAITMLPMKIKLIIVGRGSLKQKLVTSAKRLRINLQIIDMVPHHELPKVYQMADVYVQPSLMEAPVKTLLEAMSCAVPCVATNVTGIKDLISNGENGLLADLNPQELSDKVSEILINKPKSLLMGRKARELVVKKYNIFKFLITETNILSTI